MTVREYWQEVLALELSFVAHMVYWALQRGFVNEHDDWSLLADVPYVGDEVSALCAKNELGIGMVKHFLCLVRSPGMHFILRPIR